MPTSPNSTTSAAKGRLGRRHDSQLCLQNHQRFQPPAISTDVTPLLLASFEHTPGAFGEMTVMPPPAGADESQHADIIAPKLLQSLLSGAALRWSLRWLTNSDGADGAMKRFRGLAQCESPETNGMVKWSFSPHPPEDFSVDSNFNVFKNTTSRLWTWVPHLPNSISKCVLHHFDHPLGHLFSDIKMCISKKWPPNLWEDR